jgi:hypothetical protein
LVRCHGVADQKHLECQKHLDLRPEQPIWWFDYLTKLEEAEDSLFSSDVDLCIWVDRQGSNGSHPLSWSGSAAVHPHPHKSFILANVGSSSSSVGGVGDFMHLVAVNQILASSTHFRDGLPPVPNFQTVNCTGNDADIYSQ